jgi:hypothetical protein
MAVKQICLRMKNRPGVLQQVTDILKVEGVNIRAITVVDPGEEALVRMMVDDHDRACNALESNGFSLECSEVIAVEIPDHPGGLNAVLAALKEAEINVLQLYSYIGRSGENAILILGVDKHEEAKVVLKRNWVHLLDEEVYGL